MDFKILYSETLMGGNSLFMGLPKYKMLLKETGLKIFPR
jgi:hypothetical protein